MTSRLIAVVASYAPSLVLFRQHLLKELRAHGYRVVACAPPDNDVAAALRRLGVEFRPIPVHRSSLNPLANLRYVANLAGTFRRLAPHAVLTYTAKPVIWGSLAARIAGVPRVVAMITGLGFAFTHSSDANPRRTIALLHVLYRVALRRCDRVVFQNPDDLDEFVSRRLLLPDRAQVVNGSGVDVAEFQPVALPDRPVFLLIGRLIGDKGILEYAEAARIVKRDFPDAQFRLVGWFDDNPAALSRAQIESWVSEGVLEYRGSVEDVRPEIGACRIYVLPSYREGTPRTVLEAMAMGRPIITTDVPGCRETVKDGWNGFLIAARDAASLAAAMKRFLADPSLAEQMGQRSRAIAVERYEARRVAIDTMTKLGLLDDQAAP